MVQPNFLLLIFLAVFLLRSGAQIYLNWLNISYLRQHGKTVPEIFRDTIDPEKLKRISAYTAESENFAMITTLANQGLFLAVLLSGILPWLVKTISLWKWGPIVSGLIFFAALSIFTNLLRIPFSLYETFVIEERYGFNVMSFKMWVSDLLKSLLLAALLGGLLLSLLLILVIHGGNAWWVWAWMLVGGFELLMLWLFPVVILPLFNKFDPIENKELEERIRTLVGKVGLRAKGIFKMDASKRSKHTNAFFVGLGRTKRIVLFDTLLASHTEEEILSVLAHEAGHWKKRHILRMLIPLEVLSLVSFYVVAKFLNWALLYQTFGFQEPIVYVGLFLIGAFISLIGFFAQPLESAISRKFEREADDFALRLTEMAEGMRSALKRLAADNLANLSPHPLYAWFYYSHPPLVERIERLTPRADGEKRE
ncbi:MAG TPA: M48 family metallopeptidase [Thermodesulfobacteriota bacterium]|nr:M48 family metallopeptidase [Thermodesulfobacteriota bacterium]